MPEYKQIIHKEVVNIWRFSEGEIESLLLSAVGNPKGQIEFECDEITLTVRMASTEYPDGE